MGDAVTGLQGLKNTWIKDRHGCLILGDLCEKEKQFCVYQESHLLMPWKQEGRGRELEGWACGMGLPLREVPGQELRGGPIASVPSVFCPGVEFRCHDGLLPF